MVDELGLGCADRLDNVQVRSTTIVHNLYATDCHVRAAVAPTIATAFFQADAVAKTYTTLGYLVCIITILAVPIMPRAKYFQSLIMSLIAVCFGAALALLGLWTAVKARENTLPADSTPTGYNSSSAAVCGKFGPAS